MTSPFIEGWKPLRYPDNVGSTEVPNYITFRPSKIQFGGFSSRSYGNAVGSPSTATIPNANGAIRGAIDRNGRSTNGPGATVRAYFDIASSIFGSVGVNFGFDQFDRAIQNRTVFPNQQDIEIHPNKIFTGGSINLYLPNDLSARSDILYENSDLGAVGSAVATSLKNTTDKNGTDLTDYGGLAQTIVRRAVGAASPSIETLNTLNTGTVHNFYTYQIFKGVAHRRFDYTFHFIPHNEADAVNIKKICDTFNWLKLPTINKNFKTFYDLPPQWEIGYYRQGAKMEFFDQPFASVLTSVGVEYNTLSGTNQTYNDGSPLDVKLTLSFEEIEPQYNSEAAAANNSFAQEYDNGTNNTPF